MRANSWMWTACAAGVLVMVSSSGCVKRKYTPPPSVIPDPAEYPQVTVSPDLAGWVAADRPVVTHGDSGDGPLHVTVPVRTLVSKGEAIRVQYRFVFLDSKGQPVEPQGDWRYVRMPPNERRYFEANALDQRATDWQLEIRSAR